MIVIGYNYKGLPISIVAAKSQELAVAYWHGAGILPHSVRTEEEFDFNNNGTGVIPILKTEEKTAYEFDRRSDEKMLNVIK